MHLSDPAHSSVHMVIDAPTVVRNIAMLEKHCLIVHSNGGLPLLQILAEILVNPQLRTRLFPRAKRVSSIMSQPQACLRSVR